MEQTMEATYQSRKKPNTITLCPGCGNWAFYSDAKADLKCACGKVFKPSSSKTKKRGE